MPDLEILQDPKTIIRVKSSDAETHSTETLAQWESSARAAKWESEKGNEQEDGSALVCAAVSDGIATCSSLSDPAVAARQGSML